MIGHLEVDNDQLSFPISSHFFCRTCFCFLLLTTNFVFPKLCYILGWYYIYLNIGVKCNVPIMSIYPWHQIFDWFHIRFVYVFLATYRFVRYLFFRFIINSLLERILNVAICLRIFVVIGLRIIFWRPIYFHGCRKDAALYFFVTLETITVWRFYYIYNFNVSTSQLSHDEILVLHLEASDCICK